MSKLLERSKVLIVSAQINSRSAIRKALLDMGFNSKFVEVCSEFPQAKTLIEANDFNIIITDEDLGKFSAMDLIDLQRKGTKKAEDRIFILLLNSEATPFVLADFALRGGDAILSKPYKQEVLLKTLTGLMDEKDKLKPEEVLSLQIDDAVEQGNLDSARALAEKFKNKDGFPALYAKGIIAKAAGEEAEAFELLAAASAKKITFKTLVKAVNSGIKSRNYDGALPLVEKWLKEFPIHHNSIPDIIRVIVAKQKFDLLNDILNVFNTHKIQDEFVRMPLAASFVIVAQYHRSKQEPGKAVEYATKAIQQSGKKIAILHKALETMVDCGARDAAEALYLKNGAEPQTVEDQILILKIKGALYSKPKIVVECMKLTSQIVNRELYALTIDCLKAIGKDPSDMIAVAKKHFPDTEF